MTALLDWEQCGVVCVPQSEGIQRSPVGGRDHNSC